MDMEFLGAGAYRAPRGVDYPLHRHGCWELVFYREGRPECSIGDDWYHVHPGVLLVTPPRTPHMERAVTGYANYFLTVDAPLEKRWPRRVVDDGQGTLAYIFRQIVALSGQNFEGSAKSRMLPLLLAQLDIWLESVVETRSKSHGERVVRQVEQLFEERFSRPLEIGAVAEEIGVAPSALRGYFLKYRGYQPKIALRRVRLQRAMALLRTSDLSLQQVAAGCGFYSASHLSRYVKEESGVSPGRLRGGN